MKAYLRETQDIKYTDFSVLGIVNRNRRITRLYTLSSSPSRRPTDLELCPQRGRLGCPQNVAPFAHQLRLVHAALLSLVGQFELQKEEDFMFTGQLEL